MTDRLILEVGILQEETIYEFSVKISISIRDDLAGTILYWVGILKIHKVRVSIELWTDHPVLHEVLHPWFEMHSRPPSIVHLFQFIKSPSICLSFFIRAKTSNSYHLERL
jgi:hypothetical protein